MKNYDVIIVGGGPAGLICAEALAKSDLSIMLFEKNEAFGQKVCGGGLTRKGLALLDVPDGIIEFKVNQTAVISKKRRSGADAPEPFLFMVDRVELGTWQRSRLDGTHVEVRNNSKVTSITKHKVVVNDTEEYGYKNLVGADGYFSVVRKFLGLPQGKRLAAIQYLVPAEKPDPRLYIFLNSKRFHSWYGWQFPHRYSYTIGCCADPRIVPPQKLKEDFNQWLKENNIDVSNARYQAFPISYDYRGFKFGNVFLAGEAAGMASGFTGEGIYQSLVSGKTVAEIILDPSHKSGEMEDVLKYNRIQEKVMNFLVESGPFKGALHEAIVALLNNKWIKAKIHRSFS